MCIDNCDLSNGEQEHRPTKHNSENHSKGILLLFHQLATKETLCLILPLSSRQEFNQEMTIDPSMAQANLEGMYDEFYLNILPYELLFKIIGQMNERGHVDGAADDVTTRLVFVDWHWRKHSSR